MPHLTKPIPATPGASAQTYCSGPAVFVAAAGRGDTCSKCSRNCRSCFAQLAACFCALYTQSTANTPSTQATNSTIATPSTVDRSVQDSTARSTDLVHLISEVLAAAIVAAVLATACVRVFGSAA